MNSMSGEKLKGIPYTGTLPATLTGTKAGYLHRYKVYGNTEQTGTPTPDNPIYPSEVGERTANLLDEENYAKVGYLGANGAIITGPAYVNYVVSQLISVADTDGVWLSFINSVYPDITNTSMCIAFYDSNKNFIAASRVERENITATFSEFFQKPSNGAYFRYNGRITNESVMVNSGSTALPYEPYGYKLPLTSAGQNVDIYLGESQTTRRIKKLVLTGNENWLQQAPRHTHCINLYMNISNARSAGMIMSNVVTYSSAAGQNNDSLVNVGKINDNGVNLLMDMDLSDFATVNAWKTYLQEQYANGTPVIVWYVLRTPTTGTFNEPLRKIGDDADTIDSTQTTAQIPTSAGSTTISWAGSGLAPSEFDSIQEWVDIPTYTYANGEWVANNSN